VPAAVRDLDPGYFAFVMATGIISTGASFLGPSWLSKALLAVAAAAFLGLGITLLTRLVVFRANVAADFRAPDRVFGFFTVAAGADVLGVRLAGAGHPVLTCLAAQPRSAFSPARRSWTCPRAWPWSGR
jgi:tellurite resistance protein TehA-like permease